METIELAQAKPEALDLINTDALVRFSAQALNLPHQIVNTNETVEQIRADRAQAQQAQAEALAAQQAAEIANTGSQAALNIDEALQPPEGGQAS